MRNSKSERKQSKEVFCKKVVFKSFADFTGKHLDTLGLNDTSVYHLWSMIIRKVTVFWHIAFTNLYRHLYFFVHPIDNPLNYVMVTKNNFSSKQKTIIYFHLLFQVSKLSIFDLPNSLFQKFWIVSD